MSSNVSSWLLFTSQWEDLGEKINEYDRRCHLFEKIGNNIYVEKELLKDLIFDYETYSFSEIFDNFNDFVETYFIEEDTCGQEEGLNITFFENFLFYGKDLPKYKEFKNDNN